MYDIVSRCITLYCLWFLIDARWIGQPAWRTNRAPLFRVFAFARSLSLFVVNYGTRPSVACKLLPAVACIHHRHKTEFLIMEQVSGFTRNLIVTLRHMRSMKAMASLRQVRTLHLRMMRKWIPWNVTSRTLFWPT